MFIIDNSRTKSSINPRIASIQQSDHVTTQFMDKEHNLLGNQRCAHQLSLLRNTQQRASSDNTKKKSANEPTMKDKSYHFPYWHGNAKLACQQDIIFQGQTTLFLSRIMFVYHDKSLSQH